MQAVVQVGQQVGRHVGAQVNQGLGGVDHVAVGEALVFQTVHQVHADVLRRGFGPGQVAAGKGQHAAHEGGL